MNSHRDDYAFGGLGGPIKLAVASLLWMVGFGKRRTIRRWLLGKPIERTELSRPFMGDRP